MKHRRRPIRRSPPRRSRWANLLGLIPLALVAAFIYHEHRLENARYQTELTEQAQREAEQARLFARGEFDVVWQRCREHWVSELSFYQPPQALAWHRGGITAYFEQGIDRRSWRRVDCAADGVHRGPRVQLPIALPLLAEQPLDQADQPLDEGWQLAELSGSLLDGDLLGVELLQLPDGRALRRDWRGLEGGASARVRVFGGDDADLPTLPLLFASVPFTLTDPLPTLTPLVASNWAAKPHQALDLVQPLLPEGALISELSLRPEGMEISIVGEVPSFDEGQPPAPYGDLSLDEYGVPDHSWWYPRQSPGFGCASGRSIAELRQMLSGRSPPTNPTLAWYSCSPAYSDGRSGRWEWR